MTEKIKPREFRCEVKFFRNITPTVFELGFETNDPVVFKAGQFFSIVIPGAGPGGRDLRRAYSIASPPETRPIELCVKLVDGGPGTTYLNTLKTGDTFRAIAPYGDFVYKPVLGKRVCFVSTGTGLAPFRSMVFSDHFKANPPKSTICMLGVRDESELIYAKEFIDACARDSALQWVPAVSRPSTEAWRGFRGRVTDWLRARGPDFAWTETEYYLCGAGSMIDEVKKLLADQGVEKEAIHQEIYYKTPTQAAVTIPGS